MDLLPEAIREFQVASRDSNLFVESCSMIGVCYVEQGMWTEASEWYDRALTAEDLSDDADMALRYDLAGALEAAGDHERAVGIFEEIASANPAYRDVSNRLSVLSEHRQAT
jgi:tetratricopeptide (TPR) repeat protein